MFFSWAWSSDYSGLAATAQGGGQNMGQVRGAHQIPKGFTCPQSLGPAPGWVVVGLSPPPCRGPAISTNQPRLITEPKGREATC